MVARKSFIRECCEAKILTFFFFPSLFIVRPCCVLCSHSFIHKMNTVEFKSATFPNAGSRHLLDDSVMESHSPTRGQAESSTLSSGISLGKTYTCILLNHDAQIVSSVSCCVIFGNDLYLYPGSSEGSELSEEVSWPAFER